MYRNSKMGTYIEKGRIIITCLLLLLGGMEAVQGFRQLYGLEASNHSLYVLTGSFYNPGPYMGFLAVVLPVCLYGVLVGGNRSFASLWMTRVMGMTRYVSIIVGLLILCLLPAGLSRSAWIAAVAGTAYVLLMHYRERIKEMVCLHRKTVCITAIVGSILLITALCGAYHLKKDSADGRLLMWKVAAHAVCEAPWTGYGWDNVAGAYGEAQEAYFATGGHTATEEHVAGSPEYVFNEYLQVAMAWGVPVLLIGLLVTGGCWYMGHRSKQYGLCGALLSFGVFAFSSYPLQFPLFVFTFILLITGCAVSGLPMQKTWCKVTVPTVLLAIAVIGGRTYGNYRERKEAEEEWERYRILYQSGAYTQAVESYAEHYGEMKHHARFLFEYGHALHKLHRNEESKEVLQLALKVSSDPMILNIIGKNHQEMGQCQTAEHWLLRSTHRLPGRIYPYYLLAKLYAEAPCFPPEKLEWARRMVLEKEPKVHSRAIEEMREEVKGLTKTPVPSEKTARSVIVSEKE